MSVEDILYQAEAEGIRELVFEEVRKLRTNDTKYWETKDIFEKALNNVREKIKENESIQR
jgi:hypothetical protein